MYEIRIKAHYSFWTNWDTAEGIEEIPYIIERVASIVSCRPNPTPQEQGHQWSLDTCNDWWASRDGEYLIIAYRYGNAAKEQLDGLAAFLQWPSILGDG